ncbi:hypothetical protein GOP47_0009471 [Adiantum capillus-veneris]|uniref:Uncharacterized protein n=1 Tax=Adiantum capillus-veneris TaxID=13818 RepID=A0A9D4UWN8_ADICA|nr:hypothetical protein GOP47_0009470 [Adiantum capillus-veneris]KAI5075395.1 hypothetical protein GOP47_0009471 [Adiantum capillus-veneris]
MPDEAACEPFLLCMRLRTTPTFQRSCSRGVLILPPHVPHDYEHQFFWPLFVYRLQYFVA